MPAVPVFVFIKMIYMRRSLYVRGLISIGIVDINKTQDHSFIYNIPTTYL
jgi:hypothetical protein